MKKLPIYIFLISIACDYCFAETKEELMAKYILTSMQQDYITCYSFYKIGAEAVKQSEKKKTFDGIEKSADIALKFAFEMGELLYMKAKIMKEKVKDEIKKQLNEVNNDYKNTHILLERHALTCKNLIENKKQRINYWEKEAEKKYK